MGGDESCCYFFILGLRLGLASPGSPRSWEAFLVGVYGIYVRLLTKQSHKKQTNTAKQHEKSSQ